MAKLALLIGTNDYQYIDNLSYAVNDAAAVADCLRRHYGFQDNEIVLMTTKEKRELFPTRQTMMSALGNLAQSGKQFDLLVFGFFGHGFRYPNGDRYLCGHDAQETSLKSTATSFNYLMECIEAIGADTTIVILDCCQNVPATLGRYSGRFTDDEAQAFSQRIQKARDVICKRARKKRKNGVNNFKTEPTIAVLNSCSAGQVAYVWEERQHGVFTYFLIQALQQRMETADECFRYVRDQIKITGRWVGQSPYFERAGSGDARLLLSVTTDSTQTQEREWFVLNPRTNERFRIKESALKDKISKKELALETRIYSPGVGWTTVFDMFPELVDGELSKKQTTFDNILPRFRRVITTLFETLFIVLKFLAKVLAACACGLFRFIKLIAFKEFSFSLPDFDFVPVKRFLSRLAVAFIIIEIVGFVRCCSYSPEEADTIDTEQTVGTADAPIIISEWEDSSTRKAGTVNTLSLNGVTYRFHWIPAGSFQMGSNSVWDAQPIHEVTLTRGFWLLETEITQGMWNSVMRTSRGGIKKGGDYPFDAAYWKDVAGDNGFIERLNENDELPSEFRFRLPTEAEWEYSCRAGENYLYSGSDVLEEVGWANNPFVFFFKAAFFGPEGCMHSVAQKKPNAWGLYDMSGNVSEWCSDWYGDYPTGSVTDPTGPSSGAERVVRGGSRTTGSCRCADRSSYDPAYGYSDLGFRLVLESVIPEK